MTPRRSSIARKLTVMNIVVSGVALILACAAFAIYDQLTFRDGMVRTLSAQAQIIGANSTSAILFNDPEAAQTTLEALRSFPSVLSAGIMMPDGRHFADFSRGAQQNVLSAPGLAAGVTEEHQFGESDVVLVRAIVLDGKPLGTVFIRADLAEQRTRLKRYITIAGLVLVVSLIVAFILSQRLRAALAEPIMRLAETAREVSRNRDYSVRVPPGDDDTEVGTLMGAFNEMLGEIQRRDDAVRSAQADLERRVDERTQQLVAANKELHSLVGHEAASRASDPTRNHTPARCAPVPSPSSWAIRGRTSSVE